MKFTRVTAIQLGVLGAFFGSMIAFGQYSKSANQIAVSPDQSAIELASKYAGGRNNLISASGKVRDDQRLISDMQTICQSDDVPKMFETNRNDFVSSGATADQVDRFEKGYKAMERAAIESMCADTLIKPSNENPKVIEAEKITGSPKVIEVPKVTVTPKVIEAEILKPKILNQEKPEFEPSADLVQVASKYPGTIMFPARNVTVFAPPTNIRIAPSLKAKVNTVIKTKASIIIQAQNGDWFYTTSVKHIGWVHRSQIK